MSESKEPVSAGAEGNGAAADSIAVALAIAGASREKADAFLEDQRHIARLQIERLETHEPHLREEQHLRLVQQRLETSHMRVRRIADYARIAFEAGIGLVLLAVACGIGIMVWNAARADGLIIESFSVPPSLVEKGITGQVVASRLQGRLSWIANVTAAVRPPTSYANNWDNDLKVEIPDTGISIGEAYRFLRGWLGRETHLSGDIIRTPAGVMLSVRTTGGITASVAGTEDSLDELVLRTAESIFRQTEPGRYARYLFIPRPGSPQRFAEAREILLQDSTGNPNPIERAWSWTALGSLDSYLLEYRVASSAIRKAIDLQPDMTASRMNLALVEALLSHPQAALSEVQATQALLGRNPVPNIRPSAVRRSAAQNQLQAAFLQGDFAGALSAAKSENLIATNSTFVEPTLELWASAFALRHDVADAHAFWRDKPIPEFETDKVRRALSIMQIEIGLGHWREAVTAAETVEKSFSSLHAAQPTDPRDIQFRPMLALAKGRLGEVTTAQALITATPEDCYDCIRTRAIVAQAAREPNLADHWFERATAMAPSVPFAYADWGLALLERGQPDAAIEKLKIANQKGPHFADPLVYWAEALMAKNQSHLALARFAEAEKYAPNWGRLHLKWGEALVYAGKRNLAGAEFTRAAQLDLSPSEKAEVARHP